MKIKISGSNIMITKNELITTNGIHKINFHFDSDWNSEISKKIAVFYQPSINRDSPDEIEIKSDSVQIPQSSLTVSDLLYIGVYGLSENNEIEKVTDYTYTYVHQGCYQGGSDSE